MLYAIVAMIITAASFIFAMLGLGGGMVYVPVLNWAGFDMKEVPIPLGLLLNGLNTLLVLIPFTRKKLVDWKGGAVMAITALIASPLGAMTSSHVPVQTLKILFAAMVVANVMNAPADKLLIVSPVFDYKPEPKKDSFNSFVCEECGEMTVMEYGRIKGDKKVCMDCAKQ